MPTFSSCATSCSHLYQAKLQHTLLILSIGQVTVHYSSHPTWMHQLCGHRYPPVGSKVDGRQRCTWLKGPAQVLSKGVAWLCSLISPPTAMLWHLLSWPQALSATAQRSCSLDLPSSVPPLPHVVWEKILQTTLWYHQMLQCPGTLDPDPTIVNGSPMFPPIKFTKFCNPLLRIVCVKFFLNDSSILPPTTMPQHLQSWPHYHQWQSNLPTH